MRRLSITHIANCSALALVDLEEQRVADSRWLAADCDPLVLAVSFTMASEKPRDDATD